MMKPKYNIGYVGVSKKSIVRGIEVPDFNGEIKERPILVLTDSDELPYGTNNIAITTLSISSLPYTILDIPIMLSNNVSHNVSFINPFTTHTVTKKILEKTHTYIQAVLPDYIFKLVKDVRCRIDKNTKEAFDEALDMVDEYRKNMMQCNKVKCIRIPIDCTTFYYIDYMGNREYREGDVFDMSFRKYEYLNENDAIEYTIPTVGVMIKGTVTEPVKKEMRSYEFNQKSPQAMSDSELRNLKQKMGITQKLIDKNPIPIFSSDNTNSKMSRYPENCSDGELIEFMSLYGKNFTEVELAQKCGFGWKVVGDRYIVCAYEMMRRNLNGYIVDFPYGKLKFEL